MSNSINDNISYIILPIDDISSCLVVKAQPTNLIPVHIDLTIFPVQRLL